MLPPSSPTHHLPSSPKIILIALSSVLSPIYINMFTLQARVTYEGEYILFVFLSLGYLAGYYFPDPSIFLKISFLCFLSQNHELLPFTIDY